MKTTIINNQRALDYCMYMIAGSYFRSTAIKGSRYQEERFYQEYRVLKLEEQYLLEEMCIYYVNKSLRHQLPKNLWDEDVKVRLTRRPGDRCERILFYGKYFAMELMAERTGRTSMQVHCKYLVKGQEERTIITIVSASRPDKKRVRPKK